MIDSLIDALRVLTTPERLLHLLTTVVAGWWGYALLFAIVFSETGLLIGFFLPGDSLLFTVGVVAGAGGIDLPTIIITLIAAAYSETPLATISDARSACACSTTQTRASSAASTSNAPSSSMPSTEERRSSTPSFCPSSAPSPPSLAASLAWA